MAGWLLPAVSPDKMYELTGWQQTCGYDRCYCTFFRSISQMIRKPTS